MRSEEGSNNPECQDALVKLACEMDSDECPAACKEGAKTDEDGKKVAKGDLAVTSAPEEGKKVVSDGFTSYLDTLTLKASEPITLNSITLERYGYSTTEDVEKIWLEDSEGNIISSEKWLSASKDSVTLSIKKEYREISDKDTITIVLETSKLTDEFTKHGTNIGFKVTDVDSSAANLDLDDYSAYLYDIIDYDGSEVTVELKGKKKSYNVAAWEEYEVAKLKVSATNSAIEVNGFTLTNGWTDKLDLSDNVENVTVKVDGEEVKGLTYTIKKDTLKVNFNKVNIGIKKNSLFTVYVTLKDDFEDYNDKVTFYLDNTSDLKALEQKNWTTVKFSDKSKYEEEDAFEYKFIWGKVTLTNTKLASSIDAAAGSEDVIIAEWTVKLGGEPINIDSLVITPSIKDAGDLNVKDIVETIKVYVDDEDFEIDSTNNWEIKDILIEKDATIKVAVSLEDDPDGSFAGKTLQFKIGDSQSINATTLNAEWGNVEYDNSGESVPKGNIAGSISISSVKVNESKASLKNSTSTEAEFVKWQSTKKTIFEWTYTAKKSDLDLNEIALILGDAWFADTDTVTIDVIINGKTVATLDADDLLAKDTDASNIDEAYYVDFSDVAVKAGDSVSIKVVADIYADDEANETFVDQKMTLVLRGDDTNGVAAGWAKATTVKLKITDSESVKVTDNVAKKTVILQDSDVELAKFRVKPSNTDDEVSLTKLVLDFANFNNLSVDNLEITVDDDPVTVDDEDLENSTLTLDDISYNVPANWVVVEVRYTDELVASEDVANPYKVTVSKVNTSTPKTEFTRYVVPALISFSQRSVDKWATTVFTVEKIETANSETVSNLVLTYEGGGTAKLDDVAEWSTIEVNWDSSSAKFVTNVKYAVSTLDDPIEIDKGDYNDYFKVGDSYLKVFKAE